MARVKPKASPAALCSMREESRRVTPLSVFYANTVGRVRREPRR
jgi:hypothetical protein